MQQVVKGKESGVLVSKSQGWKAFPLRVNFISDLTRMNLKIQNDTVVNDSESDWMWNRPFKILALRNACCSCMACKVFPVMVPTILYNVLYLHADFEWICQIFQFISLKYVKSLTVSVVF